MKTAKLLKEQNNKTIWELSEPYKRFKQVVVTVDKLTEVNLAYTSSRGVTVPCVFVVRYSNYVTPEMALEKMGYHVLPELTNPNIEDIDVKLSDLGFVLSAIEPHKWEMENGIPRSKHALRVCLNGESMLVVFSQGKTVKDLPSLARVVYSLLRDYTALEHVSDIDEFFREYGYDSVTECLHVWDNLHRQKERLVRIGFGEVVEKVEEILQDF